MKRSFLLAFLATFMICSSAFFYGDQLEITVYNKYGMTEFSDTFTVSQNGTLALPLVGNIDVSDANESTLKKRLYKILNPHILVKPVISLRSLDNNYMISGYVQNSGKYSFNKTTYISDAIRQSGGLTEGADIYNIQIIRGTEEINIDYSGFLFGEGGRVNPQIKSGDRVLIPELDYLYVIGHVENQFKIYYDRRIDITDLILEAGSRERSALEHARILRPIEGEKKFETIDINLKRFMRAGRNIEMPKLQPGDILFIPKNRGSGLDMLWNTTEKIADIFSSINTVKTLRKVIF